MLSKKCSEVNRSKLKITGFAERNTVAEKIAMFPLGNSKNPGNSKNVITTHVQGSTQKLGGR